MWRLGLGLIALIGAGGPGHSGRRQLVDRGVTSPEIAVLAPGLLRNYVSPFTGDRGIDNPLVFAGFVLSNSETGDGAWTITPRLEIQVCHNGLVLDKLRVRKPHIGGRLPDGAVQWSADTQQTNRLLIKQKTRDAVTSFLDEQWLTARIGEVERAAGVRVSNPTEVIERVSTQLRFSETEQQTILDHFLLGGDPTSGGVLQAVTSAAQKVGDPDTARGMEAVGPRRTWLDRGRRRPHLTRRGRRRRRCGAPSRPGPASPGSSPGCAGSRPPAESPLLDEGPQPRPGRRGDGGRVPARPRAGNAGRQPPGCR